MACQTVDPVLGPLESCVGALPDEIPLERGQCAKDPVRQRRGRPSARGGFVPLRAGQMAAAAADTLISPNPVARSRPGVAGLLKRGWQRPTRTSMAVLARAWATWAGVALVRTPRSTAAAPAN